MAKTKADYAAEGVTDAQTGKPRRYEGNESWQKQCYQSAYTAQVTHEQSLIASAATITTTPGKITLPKRPDQAVIAHINALHRMRATADPMRASRLLRKIDILKVRHSPA